LGALLCWRDAGAVGTIRGNNNSSMAESTAKLRNLILVHHPAGQERRDLEEIAAKIAQIEPSIAVFIVREDVRREASGLPEEMWTRPTLMVSFQFPRAFRPKRGQVYTGVPFNKVVQIRLFAAAGVPVPRSAVFRPGVTPTRREWGDFVILKPSMAGLPAGGLHTFLVPTERVAALIDRIFPPESAVRKQPIIMQQFIDTGEHPTNFRVLCLFGEPIHCMEQALLEARPPLDAPEEQILAASIVANTKGRHTRVLVEPADILEFGRRVAKAMPGIPLQGIDVIRERGTGRLFALENNPGGNTWHFSSRVGEEGRRMVSREARIAQFGAWDIAARVLVERTLKNAL
jgi:hypothetical protein